MKQILYICVMAATAALPCRAQTVLEPAATFVGAGHMERIGYWVQYAGDVNGDGYDDFLIGNNHSGWNGWDSGAAYLVLGRADIAWGYNYPVENLDAYFIGDELDAAGYGLGGGGDVNGDGYDDILIGAPAGRVQAGARPGDAYLIFGKPEADWGPQFRLRAGADVHFVGEAPWDVLGIGAAIVGDVNGDGLDDIVIGACDNDYGAVDAGKAYLFLGKTDGWESPINVRNADASFFSNVPYDAAGYTIARAGDVNGDGIDDFLIGAFKRPGRVYMMFGRKEADWGRNFPLANADVIFYEDTGGDMGGFTIDGGDVNGDGISDVLIGAPNRHTFLNAAGKIYIFFGRTHWSGNISLGSSDASYLGEGAYDNVGLTKSLSTGFDLNRDGYDDILIGAMTNDQGGEDAGKAYVVYGKRNGWQNNVVLNQADAWFVGEDTVSYTGMGINFAGDVNGDGAPDIILAAPLHTNRRWRSGKAYLFLTENEFCSVSGKIYYGPNGEPVPDAAVTVINRDQQTQSGGNGEYELTNLSKGPVELVPSKPAGEDVRDSDISAYDAALAARHAVGIITLSGQQKLAADADNSGAVDIMDAVLILRHSVGIQSGPETVLGEWFFSPALRGFPNLINTISDIDFEACIYGDVDGSWQYGAAGGKRAGYRSGTVDTIFTATGRNVSVPVRVPENSGMTAADVRIDYERAALELIGVETAGPAADFMLLYSDPETGPLKIGMMHTEPLNASGEILEVTFRVKDTSAGAGIVSIDQCRINSRETGSSRYLIKIMDSKPLPASLRLEQNYPNPFNPATTIPFSLPEAASITVEIHDVRGRLVTSLAEGVFAQGTHTVVWDGTTYRGDDAGTGVFFCSLRLGQAVRKIKILKLK